MSSAKIAKWTPDVRGVSLIYKLYSVGTSTEPCGSPVCISLGVDNSPSTEIVNVLLVRIVLISFVKFVGNCNFDVLYSKPGFHVVSKAFSISGNTAAVIDEVHCYIIRESHTLQCHVESCTKAKLT